MLDTDTLLMKRALELARRGAGLVSPNPLVGAVLVNGGSVVGEGYHLYKGVRHAESYAIESAGALAGGSTLYCNLEPCCHHGRTPPCTDALIEAKIARAVIAVKDPNPSVNGRGIERLREAGIEVEVGLLEERAIRINESYFKFITRGTPFIHGVIEFAADASPSLSGWHPSDDLLQAVSTYDAVMIGDRRELNGLMVDEARHRKRHRPLVVAAASDREPQLRNFLQKLKVSVVPIETQTARDASSNIVNLDRGAERGAWRSQIGLTAMTLARMNVTSVVILPGVFDLSDPSNFDEIDKVTLIVPRSVKEQRLGIQWSLGDIEFDLEDVSTTEAEGFTELTGYPSSRAVA
jgi:diaminohydroxyphosphoribosylaminopyrimidine deaminase/5-amino-6-(5-phosphoribosylamino)uracil reductase